MHFSSRKASGAALSHCWPLLPRDGLQLAAAKQHVAPAEMWAWDFSRSHQELSTSSLLEERGLGKAEFYKETPELAKAYITSVPEITAKEAVVFKPLNLLEKAEKPEAIVFLVNADQLSALVTLATMTAPPRTMSGSNLARAATKPSLSHERSGGGKRHLYHRSDRSFRPEVH